MADTLTKVTHALQPLSAEEIAEAVSILRKARGVDDRYRFGQVSLLEPKKADVLAADANGNGNNIERQAKVVLIDRLERTTVEAVISLSTGILTSWENVNDGGQPSYTFDEMLGVEIVVREHPDFIAAMNKRGISNLDLVWVDPWTFGAYEDESDLFGRRLARGLVWARDSEDDENGYAHPIENVIVTFDLH